MNDLLRTLPVLALALAVLAPAQAQETRTVPTRVLRPAAAPVEIDAYEASHQTLEDGFHTLAFLTETVALVNVSARRVAAVEVAIIYLGAFGEEIDEVRETVIRTIEPGGTASATFRSPLAYTIPVYSAVAYPRQVRLEPSGAPEGAALWRADSTDVADRLRRLAERDLVVRERE